ncbi:MAG: hypothetical protein K6F63_03740 [Lachnospiraceae bacterium]|nr:hypothetical protein [Lachnospiraceae bacterium]
MKKVTKKLVAFAASFLMLVSVLTMGTPAAQVLADETAESYYAFVAIGAGDAWEYQYYGKTSGNSGAVVAQDAYIAVGETKTISVTMPDTTTQAWFHAPCIIIPGATEVDFDVALKVDGKDVAIDLTAGKKLWWPEGTGAWDATECIRLAGGYNEWGDKFSAKPVNFKTVEYTITLKKVVKDTSNLGFYSFLAMGGAEDWSMGYQGKDNTGNYTGVVANDQYLNFEGDALTVTYALEFDKAVDKVWWMAPVITGANFKTLDFTIDSIKFDGNEITPDLTQGDAWWTEGVGDAYATDSTVRLAGGYNEWGSKYIGGESNPIPSFTKVEYTITFNQLSADEKYLAFVAIGGDSDTGSWDMSYTGPGSETEGVVGKTAYVAAGDTVTVGVTFPQNFKHAYYTAPCIVAEGVNLVKGHIDSVKIDGKEVAVNMDAGKFWWYEATGDYDEEHCVRLGGGYNEWASQYIAAPENFTSIEYTFTIDKISKGNPAKESDETFELGIAYGGDKKEQNDWGYGYVTGFNAEIEGGSEFIKVGETKTVSLKFASKPVYTWYVAPYLLCLDTSKVLDIDFDIVCKIDGKEIPVDLTAGKAFWTEGTGDYTDATCFRLAGGYNEWGSHYIESPKDFTTIEYTITLNSFLVAEPEVVEFDPALLSGKYDAYLTFQCPDTWVYRDDWMNEASGGIALWKDIADNFNHVTWNEGATPEEQNIGGTFVDAVIDGNGTYTVSLTGAEAGLKGSEKYNMLKVSTNIPYSCLANGLEITEASVSVDGKKPVTDFVLYENKVESDNYPEYNGSYISIEFINTYNSKNPAALDSVQIPQESIVCTFTVKGFDHDNTAAAQPAAEPEKTSDDNAAKTEGKTETPASEASTAVDSEKKGGVNVAVIVIIVVLAVAAVGCGAFFVIKKKKK